MAGSGDILSVGVDIGTSTTKVVFSRLFMENTAGYFSVPRIAIVNKTVVYRSEIHATPLRTQSLIDVDAVRGIVEAEYRKAGFTPADVDTGAVIITGEAARKENSALVLERLSSFAGDFVVSTAGPDLEAVIAGEGSGARRYSEEMCCAAVNLDIGGGTANIALFDCGQVTARGCLDIGGRLIRLKPDYTVTYISLSAALIAQSRGIGLNTGERASLSELRGVCRGMAQLLEECLGLEVPSPLLPKIRTPGSSLFELDPLRPIRAVFFSGGVADAIYRGGTSDNLIPYGDIGALLGEAVREGKLCSAFSLQRGRETIRATVVGAGSCTTTISGSTITYTPGIFPLKNIPVLKLGPQEQEAAFRGDYGPAVRKIRWFLEQSDSGQLVLAMEGEADPSYPRLKALASSLARAAEETLPRGTPLLLAVERDMAKALGQAVFSLAGGRPVVVLDSIRAEQDDYMDMGRPLMDGLVVPVVVKTLIFG